MQDWKYSCWRPPSPAVAFATHAKSASQMHDASGDAPGTGVSSQSQGDGAPGARARSPKLWCEYSAISKRPSRAKMNGPSFALHSSHSCQASTVHISTCTGFAPRASASVAATAMKFV